MTPKFRVGQVVWWGNGKGIYVRISEVLPLHCKGACQCYAVRPVRHGFEPYYPPDRYTVSEDVLAKLTLEEIGL